jgi:hypothetical protein
MLEGESVTTLRQSLDLLSEGDQNFARSLIDQLARKGSLSAAQWHWMRVLAERAKARKAPKAERPRLPNIHGLMSKAASVLTRAAITMRGFSVRTSRTHGVFYVKDSSGSYLGKITEGGEFWVSREAEPRAAQIAKELADLEADPVKAATVYGHETGCCCFCTRPLTDSRSIEVGYGPVCADRFGLPWGVTGKKPRKGKRSAAELI